MIKYLTILFLFASCSTTVQLQDGTTAVIQNRIFSKNVTVTLNGSKSHATGGKYLVSTKWRSINGKATIKNPGSLVTSATMKASCTFELWGKDNAGLSATDTMQVKY
ncbi:MAG TPA: hypothetical protein VIJ57_03045 [Hanamia sp.]